MTFTTWNHTLICIGNLESRRPPLAATKFGQRFWPLWWYNCVLLEDAFKWFAETTDFRELDEFFVEATGASLSSSWGLTRGAFRQRHHEVRLAGDNLIKRLMMTFLREEILWGYSLEDTRCVVESPEHYFLERGLTPHTNRA